MTSNTAIVKSISPKLEELINKAKTNISSGKKYVLQAYQLALEEGFTPLEAKNLLIEKIQDLSRSSIYRYLPDTSKDQTKAENKKGKTKDKDENKDKNKKNILMSDDNKSFGKCIQFLDDGNMQLKINFTASQAAYLKSEISTSFRILLVTANKKGEVKTFTLYTPEKAKELDW